MKQNLESENLSAENGTDKKQVKHCHTRCKFKGEDEKHGEMIECCLCRTWYHLGCLEKKSLRGNEKKTKDQQNEDDGQSASNVQEDSVEVFVKETQEDKDGEESENESGDDDNDESESEEDINDGSGIWFCQDCENLPKTLREIKKSFNTMQKEFKSLETRFEDFKVQSSSNDSEAVTPTFAENKAVDNTSETEEKRKLIEQNIVLTRENLELKDRLNIMERLSNQVLQDQEDKKKIINERYDDHHGMDKHFRSQSVRAEQKGIHPAKASRNYYEVLSELETDCNDEDSECDSASFQYKRVHDKPRKRQQQKPQESSQHGNKYQVATGKLENQRKNETQGESRFVKTKERGKTVVIGHSQLHHIEENRLSGRKNKTLVRSKGGLKIHEVSSVFKNILEEDADEFVFHVGVNNVEKETEDEIVRKYVELGQSIVCARVTFSSIIKRADKPELNVKIANINSKLKVLCMENGFDFIENNNIGFRHLARDKLHINKEGQRILALNFLNHLRTF